MSLRTKLLAAVVGLNGAILLLALFLLLGSEPEAPEVPSPDLIADLAAFGGALAASETTRDRTHALEFLEDLNASRLLRDLVVVEEAEGEEDGGSGRSTQRVWRPEAFLQADGPGEEMEDGDVRQHAERAFWHARSHHLHRWADADTIAVVLPLRLPEGVRRGIVAHYDAPPDRRSGVREVYLVMVVGVIVLTAVNFWLISRLVMRPLAHLTEAADRIACGDFRIHIERRGTNDEFDRTMAAFDRMAREIAEYQGHLEDRVLSALKRVRKAEQHLAIAQRLAATGKLASGLAHEINNPLGGLKNAVRALARGDLSPEKTGQYLDLIADGLSRVEDTVKQFLSFTPRRVEPRPTDLAIVAHEAVQLARHRIERSAIALEEKLEEPGGALVFGDPRELQQVALNLLLNAADAVGTSPGGRIVLLVADRGEEVVLEVEDNGVGLSPEDQDRCFDLFFTTKEVGEGTGLGLAVAHTIITNHGGRIEVESRLGEGAIFRVVLPSERSGPGDEE